MFAVLILFFVVAHVFARITKPAIFRLGGRRGSVKRISGLIYEEAHGVLKIFLKNVRRFRFVFFNSYLSFPCRS
jgi:hypothetical protein